MMLRALITGAALAVLAAPAAPAAMVSYSGDTLVNTASPGETNSVVVDGKSSKAQRGVGVLGIRPTVASPLYE